MTSRSHNLLVINYLAGDPWLTGQVVFSVHHTAFASEPIKGLIYKQIFKFCKVCRVSKVIWLHW